MAPPIPPAPNPDDRHGRILAELAGMGLELARDLRERALAAETPEEATQLARAFHTVSRGVRQSLALELKVARFRAELAREDYSAAQAEAAVREPHIDRRREEIGREVERLIYTEYEGYEHAPWEDPRANRLQWKLNDWMKVASARPDFTTDDLDRQILAACEALGLDPARFATLDDDEDHGDGDNEDGDADEEPCGAPAPADSS